jgi:hypothetical protein
MSILGRRLSLSFLGMPLACLSAVLFASPSARAGCDYPSHIENTPVNQLGGLATVPKTDTQMPSKPCSCTGPYCSRQPLAPPAPTSVESVKISEWASLLSRLFLTPPPSDSWVPETPFAPPPRHPISIYHPPRLAL